MDENQLKKLIEDEHLTEEEQKYLNQIIKEYQETGNSELFEVLAEIEYNEFPVDFITFLYDPRYLGNCGGKDLYKFWVQEHLDFLDSGAYEYIATGGIGTGKTTALSYLIAYDVYKLCCFKNPQGALKGLSANSPIKIVFTNLTKANAESTGYIKFMTLISKSPFFQEYGRFTTGELPTYIPHYFQLKFVMATRAKDAIGGDVFCVDENTLVNSKKQGIVPIKFLLDTENDQIETYNITTEKNEFKKYDNIVYSGKKNIIELKLDNGMVLNTTLDHELYCYDEKINFYRYVQVSEIIEDIQNFDIVS